MRGSTWSSALIENDWLAMVFANWKAIMRQYALIISLLLSFFISLCCAQVARADVQITFYSHDFDDYFPHAFIKLKGNVDKTGEAVDTNYGFTATSTSPAILWGSVQGMVETKDAKYVRNSQAHFSLRLSDNDYARIMELVQQWRDLPGKSYNLGKRNCIHFTMEAAALLGLSVNRKSKFFKKPKSFMVELMALNPDLRL